MSVPIKYLMLISKDFGYSNFQDFISDFLNLEEGYTEEELKTKIAPFRVIHRLVLYMGREGFLEWLNAPNWQLGDLSPFDVINSGNVKVIRDLAVDMISGNPT